MAKISLDCFSGIALLNVNIGCACELKVGRRDLYIECVSGWSALLFGRQLLPNHSQCASRSAAAGTILSD
jgi:hypothetical protein